MLLVSLRNHTRILNRKSVLVSALQSTALADAAIAQSEREAQSFWAIRDAVGEVTPTLQPLLAFDVSLPIDEMKSLGMTFDYIEVAGGDHMVPFIRTPENMRKVFDFLDAHPKR